MKNIRKHLSFLALTLLLAVAAVLAVPNAAEAAKIEKSKSKSSTLSVTKISGFKTVSETVSLNDKYVILFGTNSKGKNVYAYSKDGKNFSKAKQLGMTGDICCQYAGEHLYVLTKNDGKTTCKYVTDPAKLASAETVDIDEEIAALEGIDLKTDSNDNIGVNIPETGDEGDVDYGRLIEESTGKFLLSADYVTSAGEKKIYIITLDKTSVIAVDLTAVVQKDYPKETVSLVGIPYANNSGTRKACFKVFFKSNKFAYYMTQDGESFTSLSGLPKVKNYETNVQWIGSKLLAWHTDGSEGEGIRTTSGGKPIYYMYENGKWKKKTAPIKASGETEVSVGGYTDYTGGKEMFCLYKQNGKSCQVVYTTNGTSWKKLPTLNEKNSKEIYFDVYKNQNGIYAYGCDYRYDSSRILYAYQLKSGKWKRLSKVTLDDKYFDCDRDGDWLVRDDFRIKSVSAAYSNPLKEDIGINLETGKAYMLPFRIYGYCEEWNQSMVTGNTRVYFYKNTLYGTKNTYKTVTAITLKAGSNKVKSEITGYYEGTVKGKEFFYLQCGKAVYSVSGTALQKAVK